MPATVEVQFTNEQFAISDFDHPVWQIAESALLNRYWSGILAPPHRHAAARLLWSNEKLLIRFDCAQGEPYVISQHPQVTSEAAQLWERDVCELFIAPREFELTRYFEFEVAPTGEWLDVAINQLPDRRESDWTFDSGMQTAAQMNSDDYTVVFAMGWRAFGRKPAVGEQWRGNLFRCVGAGETRGYLVWQPTFTAQPAFHVPTAFGNFEFCR